MQGVWRTGIQVKERQRRIERSTRRERRQENEEMRWVTSEGNSLQSC